MTDEMIMRFEHRFKEEMSDAISYHGLMKEAEKNEHIRLAVGLHSIMKDEKEHAEFIYGCLEKHGYEIEKHPEEKALWEKVEELT